MTERDSNGRIRQKYSPDEPRQCPRCERMLEAEEFYAHTRNEDGSIRTRGTFCKQCCRERQRELRGHKPRRKSKPPSKAKRRMRYIAYRARLERDPERLAQVRAQKREQARRRRERAKTDPAVDKAIRRATKKAYRKRVADPQTREEMIIDRRIHYRLTTNPRYRYTGALGAFEDSRDYVDPAPFLAFVRANFGGLADEDMEGFLGIDSHRLRHIEDQRRVSIAVVDHVLTAGLGRPDLLNALYPIEDAAA